MSPECRCFCLDSCGFAAISLDSLMLHSAAMLPKVAFSCNIKLAGSCIEQSVSADVAVAEEPASSGILAAFDSMEDTNNQTVGGSTCDGTADRHVVKRGESGDGESEVDNAEDTGVETCVGPEFA